MKSRLILLMALTVVITRLWELFHNESQRMVDFWATFGLDLKKKYDLFLYVEHEQFIHWYAQYTNYLLSIVILSYIIYKLVKNSFHKPIIIASVILLTFSIFRLISYWLFRGSIEFDLIGTVITLFLISISQSIQKWRQSSL